MTQVLQDADGLPLSLSLPTPNVACMASFCAKTDRAGTEWFTTRRRWLIVGSRRPLYWIGQYIDPAKVVGQYARIAAEAGKALENLPIELPVPSYVRAAVTRTVPEAELIRPAPRSHFNSDNETEAGNLWTFSLHWLGWSEQRPLASARRHTVVRNGVIPYDVNEDTSSDTSPITIKSECDVILSSIEMIDWLLCQEPAAVPTSRSGSPRSALADAAPKIDPNRIPLDSIPPELQSCRMRLKNAAELMGYGAKNKSVEKMKRHLVKYAHIGGYDYVFNITDFPPGVRDKVKAEK
jgi:hypothetical protein